MLANLCAFYAVFFIAFSEPLIAKETAEQKPSAVSNWAGASETPRSKIRQWLTVSRQANQPCALHW